MEIYNQLNTSKCSNESHNDNEFENFYSNLYITKIHGPPVVGSFIITSDSIHNEFLFSYPDLELDCVQKNEVLGANYRTDSYTSKRDYLSELQSCLHLLPDLAFGSRKSNSLVDFVNFILPTSSSNVLFGISYVLQLDDQKESVENLHISEKGGSHSSGSQISDQPKSYVAICLITKVPFFGLIGSRFEYVAQTYFNNKDFKDNSLLSSFVEQINREKVETVSFQENHHLQWSYESLFFNLEVHFQPFSITLSSRALLFLLKSILTEKRIIIYSELAARTSTCILSLLTMVPCLNSFNFNSNAFGSLWFSWKKYGFPLQLFRPDNPVYPFFKESMVSLLDQTSGYLIGITEMSIVKKLPHGPDVIFDIEDEIINLKTVNSGFYSPSFYEITKIGDFNLFDEVELDEDPFKTIMNTTQNVFHIVGNCLSRAPSTLINLGKRATYIYQKGINLGSRKKLQLNLNLMDIYLPSTLPKLFQYCDTKASNSKKPSQSVNKTPINNTEGDLNLKDTPKDPTKDSNTTANSDQFYDHDLHHENNSQEPFTFTQMFQMMSEGTTKLRYLGYISTLETGLENDRTREMQYSIMTKIQPMRDLLLNMMESVAYAGGKGRKPYHILMDFNFDLDSIVDFNNPVTGVYIMRNGKYYRGSIYQVPDSEDELGHFPQPETKTYIIEGDQVVKSTVSSMLATKVLEIQNNHSLDFLENWTQTHSFHQFYKNHNLEVFNEPLFYLNSNVAKYTYPNGDFYVGDLFDMLRHGKGSYVKMDGSRYEGDWKYDKRNGSGTLISEDFKYSGEWSNDKMQGFGRLETKSSVYVGDFKQGKYHGNGTLTYKNGTEMKGQFKRGRFEGRGIKTMPDGLITMGNFRDGNIRGVCSVIDPAGSLYVGELYGDMFHGKGLLKYNKNTSFQGVWEKGKRVGQGTVKSNSEGLNFQIEGVWENDSMLMNDVMVTFPNSFKYTGSLRYLENPQDELALMEKTGELATLEPPLTGEDLSRLLEKLKALDNKLLPHGRGICKSRDGGVYNGSFFMGSRHGNFTLIFPDGAIFTGLYHLGAFHGPVTAQLECGKALDLVFEKGELKTVLNDQEKGEITHLLAPSSLFEEEFSRYKLDSLMRVIQSQSGLENNVKEGSKID